MPERVWHQLLSLHSPSMCKSYNMICYNLNLPTPLLSPLPSPFPPLRVPSARSDQSRCLHSLRLSRSLQPPPSALLPPPPPSHLAFFHSHPPRAAQTSRPLHLRYPPPSSLTVPLRRRLAPLLFPLVPPSVFASAPSPSILVTDASIHPRAVHSRPTEGSGGGLVRRRLRSQF